MNHPGQSVGAAPDRSDFMPLASVQTLALWLFIFAGWFVIVEPAPYEILFVLAFVMYLPSGLIIHKVMVPLILFLLLYNLGGALSVVQVYTEPKTVRFVVTSAYMAATAIFIAMCVSRDTLNRVNIIRNAWIFAGVIASINGMIGYFDIAGMAGTWAPIQRAQGTFKDPNVLSTFLIAPIIFLVQGFMLGTQKFRLPAIGALLILIAGLFLAFSRGAWISAILSVSMLVLLTFIVTPSLKMRSRLVLFVIFGALLLMVLFTFALSFENIRSLFLERASLVQSYDGGETGRFGRQLRSLALLVELPNGMGPRQFAAILGQDPHNVFINAFAAYGWLGGLSYILLILATISAGFKSVFTRSPFQHLAIAVWCTLFFTILQGIQIDTDHWRHFYLLLGLTWGMYAASIIWRDNRQTAA